MKKTTKLVCFVLAVCLLATPALAATGAVQANLYFRDISITVDGEKLVTDAEPFIYEDTTYVPLRVISEAFGCDVQWDDANNSVIINSEKAEQPAEQAAASSIKSVSPISQVFGDGIKISHIAVEYDKEIDASSLSTDSYSVVDSVGNVREVVAVYTNNETAITSENIPGNYVILELYLQSPLLGDTYASDGRMGSGGTAASKTPISVATVTQEKDIKATDGTVYASSPVGVANKQVEISHIADQDTSIILTLQEFELNHWYTEPETATDLYYNIYKPEGYQTSGEKYPLVIFVQDAGHISGIQTESLYQGDGATAWASPEFQAEHPCFVISLILSDRLSNDYWEILHSYEKAIVGLCRDYLPSIYPIDTNRLYCCGQSMGGMFCMQMVMDYPDVWAAGLSAACQWDPELLEPLKNQNYMFFTGENDASAGKSNPLREAVEIWEDAGADVLWVEVEATDTLDPDTWKEAWAPLGAEVENPDSIYHHVYAYMPAGCSGLDADNNNVQAGHNTQWCVIYTAPYVREWIFNQTNDSKLDLD